MKIRRIYLLFSIAAAVFGLARCDSQTSDSNVIIIATAGPMTGKYASFGEQMLRGAEQAVKDINEAGGGAGQKAQA